MYGRSRRGYYLVRAATGKALGRLVLEVYDAIDSTMDAKPPALPSAVAAVEQRRGRGRTGPWLSPRGGAWLTVFLPTQPPPGLPVAVGGCLAARLERLVRGRLLVKWPNDVMAPTGKLAGVLVEYRGGLLRVGVGVNVYNNPPTGAASLSSLGYQGPLSRVYFEVVEAVLAAVHQPKHCIEEAKARDILRGCKVKVVDEKGETVEGLAKGIDDDGSLTMIWGGERVKVYCCHVQSYNCP